MEAKALVGIGRVAISSRERLVLVEPRGPGLLMSVLRSADEVREAEFGTTAKGEVDADMVAVAETIMERRKAPSIRRRFATATRTRFGSLSTAS
jgi:DNA end-binding protein Ku